MITPSRITDWDDAYSNGAYIPSGDTYPARWAAQAAAIRDSLAVAGRAALDQPYGEGPRDRYDLFTPATPALGTVVFVHGGYWMAFDKGSWSHLAAGALAHGWAVAMPSYTLCPNSRISGITRQIGQAVDAIARRCPGPLRLTGHSAGGHLVSRMACADAPLEPETAARITRIVSLSGLHDLRPLLATRMNTTLHLNAAEAAAESPALLTPRPDLPVICWAGAEERPEFRRQNSLLASVWRGLGATTAATEALGRHHFDVIDDLADPGSALIQTLLAG